METNTYQGVHRSISSALRSGFENPIKAINISHIWISGQPKSSMVAAAGVSCLQ